MGAWIETPLNQPSEIPVGSHPLWVRGLKHIIELFILKINSSHPLWVRGLKRYGLSVLIAVVSRILYGCVD